MNEWISRGKIYTNEIGGGKLGELEGAKRWTETSEDCLDIDDIETWGGEEAIAIESGN